MRLLDRFFNWRAQKAMELSWAYMKAVPNLHAPANFVPLLKKLAVRVLWLIALVVLGGALVSLAGCGVNPKIDPTPSPAKETPSELARNVVKGQVNLSKAIYLFGEWVEKFPGDSIPKNTLSDRYEVVKEACKDQDRLAPAIIPAVVESEKEKQQLQKQNQKLLASDPDRKRLSNFGLGFALGGLVLIIGSFFMTMPALLLWRGHVRAAGVFLLLLGLSAYSLAYYLVEIRLVIIGLIVVSMVAGLVWAIAYAIRNRRLLVDSIKGIDAGRAAGQIIFTPEASDPAKSVVKAFQSELTQKFVDAVQAKPTPPAAPSPAPAATSASKPA